MALQGEYLGMSIYIDDLDQENLQFFSFCGKHELRLQQCQQCDLKRFPPTTSCPHCAHPDAEWVPLSGKGTVYSYGEVHHAIQPAFRDYSPYMLLLVELDEQRDIPNEFDGLRMQGNLATSNGELAPAELVRTVGVGTRVKVVFKDAGNDVAVPLWEIDDSQPTVSPWRYAIE